MLQNIYCEALGLTMDTYWFSVDVSIVHYVIHNTPDVPTHCNFFLSLYVNTTVPFIKIDVLLLPSWPTPPALFCFYLCLCNRPKFQLIACQTN